MCHLKPSFNKLPEMFFLARKSKFGLSTCTKPMKIEGKGLRKLHKQDEKTLKIRQIEEKDQERKKEKTNKRKQRKTSRNASDEDDDDENVLCVVCDLHDALQNTTDEMVSWVQCDRCLSWCHISCTELEENNVPDRWLCIRCSEVWC